MAPRPALGLAVFGLSVALVACGGDSTTTAPTTTVAATTTAASTVPSTVPVTEPVVTEPPTTIPPPLDLSALPGHLAVFASTCGAEPAVQSPTSYGFVCILNPDGTNAQALSQPGESPGFPSFTRDGKYVIFQDSYQGVFIVDLATGARRLRERGEHINSGVSPDGQWIGYFDIDQGGGLSVSRSDFSPLPDGSLFQKVVDDIWAQDGLSWSPDSMHFAYVSSNDGSGGQAECPDLWTGSRDGTPPLQLTHSATDPDSPAACPNDVRWSPDGTKLLLTTLGKPYGNSENLYLMKPDGTGLTALTHGGVADPNSLAYYPEGSAHAGAWSPDGAQIAFLMTDGETFQLYIMNADGTQVTLVAAAPGGLAASGSYITWAQS